MVGQAHKHEKAIDEVRAQVAPLDHLQHVVGVFAKIKDFITTEDADRKVATVQGEIDKLHAQLNGFTNQLNGYLTSQEQLKTTFDNHVEHNFKIVEKECDKIKAVIESVGEASAGSQANTQGEILMQIGHTREQVRRIGEQLNGVTQEVGGVKGNLNRINEHVSMQLTAVGKHKCHCFHVDQLDARVIQLESAAVERAGQSAAQGQGVRCCADPWSAALRRGRDGGGGDDDPDDDDDEDGDGPGGGGGRRPVPRVNETVPEMKGLDLNKLFDDKVALSAAYAYDGNTNGEHWRRKVRGYWVSKCPALLPILDRAEDMDEKEITLKMLKRETNSCRWMTEIDISRVGEVIWGFLNLCLQDRAHTCFEGADTLNGFDGWRLVVQHVHQGQQLHKAVLRRLVKNPPNIGKLEDVAMGITRFENIMKDYKAAGGKLPDESELKEDLVNTLPQEIRENLLWRASKKESFSAFRNHIRTTANSMLYHRAKFIR